MQPSASPSQAALAHPTNLAGSRLSSQLCRIINLNLAGKSSHIEAYKPLLLLGRH